MNSGLTKNGESLVPSAYVCDGIFLTNHKGKSFDIQNIVTEFSIKESLYNPFLTCSFSVRDAVNFLEFHEIIGQEVVVIKLSKTDPRQTKEISLKFFITEYPLYAKSEKQDSFAVFTFKGISRHAYLSQLKKVSKSFNGNVVDNVCKLLEEKELGLDFPKKNIICDSSECVTTMKYVIPFSQPLIAISRLLNVAVDAQGSPFYMYQTLKGDIHIKSLANLLDETKNPPYGNPYVKTTNFKAEPNTIEDYSERMQRILKINSDLKLNTIGKMRKGTYASENNFLDISSKQYKTIEYDYLKDYAKDKPSNINPEWKINEKSLNEYSQSYSTYISTNDLAFSESPEGNISEQKQLFDRLKRSQQNLLDTQTHTIVLNGDFDLISGRLIEILIPKSIANQNQSKLLDVSETEVIDEAMSGKYLVTGVTHLFKQGQMISNLKIKRAILHYER